MTSPRFGGPWTEQKLGILRAYLTAYTTALKNQPFTLIYVDGFAGAGSYRESRADYDEFHEFRQGSTRIALEIDDKPFDKLVFIEKDTNAAEGLLKLASEYQGRQIEIIRGDANVRLPRFCRNMSDFDRAVVFLDPYATEVSWMIVEEVAKTKKIDCWILFPLMAVARMMPTDKEPNEAWARRLDRIFGDRQHWQQSYHDSPQLSFFGNDQRRQRTEGSEQIADKYRERLRTVFHSVAPTRCTLRNSKEAPLFELFFAVSNPTGAGPAMRIANDILRAWMTSPFHRPTSLGGPYELVDNVDYGSHQQALEWLAERYAGPLNVATGYVSLEGLDALARIAAGREQPTSLLIGATPEALAGPARKAVADRFEQQCRRCAVSGTSPPSPPPAGVSLSE